MQEADAAFPLTLSSWPSLEAQIAAIADDIAYDNHDIDDGLRAGILSLDQILSVPLVARCWDRVRARFPDHPAERLMHELVRERIGVMVNDLLETTRANIITAGLGDADAQAVREAGGPLLPFRRRCVTPSGRSKASCTPISIFIPAQLESAERAKVIVADLFEAYRDDPPRMGDEWTDSCSQGEPMRSRHIADYIAGMTDRFAERVHRGIYGSKMDRRVH